MEKTRLFTRQLSVDLQPTGRWRIDGTTGKTMCLIIMDHKQLPVSLVTVPEHSFCEEFLDNILEAEWKNDNFIFSNGKYGKKSKRPPQLQKTIDRIKKILDKWQEKNGTRQTITKLSSVYDWGKR